MHPNNTQFKQDHQPDKNITRKLLFRVNTSLFWSTKWKGNSSLWPYGPSDKYRHYYCDRKKQKCPLTQVL